jgi:hypothetical protein
MTNKIFVMKKSMLVLSVLIMLIVTVLFAFKPVAVSSITGRVSPADASEAIWIISGRDSVKGAVVMGAFSIEVKPGTYSVIIDAKSPYRDRVVDNVQVMAEQSVDIGEIILQQ